MLIRPNPGRLQRFLSIPTAPVDDRGQPVRPKEREIMGALESRHTPGRNPLWRYIGLIPLALYVLYMVWRVAATGWRPTAASPLLVYIVVFTIVWLAGIARRKAGLSPGRIAVSATSAAMGHCGACGYDLTTLHPAADGCVPCPECGAAWHVHRRTHVGLDPESLAKLVKKIPQHQQQNNALGITDDRGVRLQVGYSWPRPTFAPKLPPSAAPAVALYRKHRRTLLMWCLAAAGAVWVIAVALTAYASGSVSDTAYAALIASVLLPLIALLISLVSLPSNKVRRLSLKAARCPQCYTPLDTELVCFDGCTICRGCRAAWNAEHVGPLPPSTSDSSVT